MQQRYRVEDVRGGDSRVYGGNGVSTAVGEHGSLDVGVVHFHHERTGDACALLDLGQGFKGLVLSKGRRTHMNVMSSHGHTDTDTDTDRQTDRHKTGRL